ncbi:MAG: SPOR domain-containing protein [Caulobacteraceae bacterium]
MRDTIKAICGTALGALLALGSASLANAKATAYPPFPKARSEAAAIQWILGETDLSLNRVTAISDTAVFALVEGPTLSPGSAELSVKVREEVLNADMVKAVGGRSALMSLKLDCGARRLKLESLEVRAGSNLMGAPKRQRGGDWMAAPAGSYLADVVSAGCDPAYRFPYSAVAVQSAAPRPAAASPAPPAPPKAIAQAPAPAPTPPPAAIPSSAATPTAKTASLRPALNADAPPAAKAAVARGKVQAQVGAYPSPAVARAELAKLSSRFKAQMAGRPKRVEATAAKAPRFYRALVGGFATPAQAESFCQALRAEQRPCLVRR